MNMNLAHNIINVAIAGLGAALVASGCSSDATGAIVECSRSWVDPQITVPVIAGLGFVKLGMNIWRDGITGLVKRQPPVK